jgi:hypothetical protein
VKLAGDEGAMRAYLTTQMRERETEPGSEPGRAPFVTISRQSGTEALAVAHRLARELAERGIGAEAPPWTVFERDLLRRVVEEHGLPESYMRDVERRRYPALQTIVEEMFGGPSVRTLVAKTGRTILHLATMGNAILIGRGSNVVTRRLRGGIRVRLVGSPRTRLRRIMTRRDLDRTAAEAAMTADDEARRRYVRTYLQRDIEDPLLYDLVLNTDALDHRQTARTIADALAVRRDVASSEEALPGRSARR